MNFANIKKLFQRNKERKRYLSCEYIQHGFNADYEDIKMCCMNTHEGGGRQVLIPDYYGETIDWDKFFEEKRQMGSTIKPLLVYAPAINENSTP